MTHKMSLSENPRRFENRFVPSHSFDSLFVSDIAPSRAVHPVER